eukprot:6178236-Pleurochrysis_carterae.AAC.8
MLRSSFANPSCSGSWAKLFQICGQGKSRHGLAPPRKESKGGKVESTRAESGSGCDWSRTRLWTGAVRAPKGKRACERRRERVWVRVWVRM